LFSGAILLQWHSYSKVDGANRTLYPVIENASLDQIRGFVHAHVCRVRRVLARTL